MVLRVVLFDLDGTLIDSEINFQKMKRRTISFLETSGVKHGLLTRDMLNYDIEKRASEYLREKGVSEEKIQGIFQKVAEIMNEIELEAVKNVKLIDGVVETIEKLRNQGLKIGIITRSCREYLDKILKKFEFGRLIDAVAARDDVSKPKPNPEHPQYLMKILGVKPSESLLIGDSSTDALCAKKVGISFFLIPRRRANLNEYKEHDREILQDIRDLVYILAKNKNETKQS